MHGVEPQVRVAGTIEGLRQGKDEVLEEALEIVRRQIEATPVDTDAPT